MHESSALEIGAAERRRPTRHWILFFMRLVLGGIFTFSAWSKIMAPQALADAIVGFDIIPESIALEAAIMLIWLELICGIFMLLGLWARATVIVITGMLTLFEIGLISVVVRGIEVNCGCFGQFSEMQVGWHLKKHFEFIDLRTILRRRDVEFDEALDSLLTGLLADADRERNRIGIRRCINITATGDPVITTAALNSRCLTSRRRIYIRLGRPVN